MKGQIRFLEDLDKIEKQKKDKLEQEKIIRAAKVIAEGKILSRNQFIPLLFRVVRKRMIPKQRN